MRRRQQAFSIVELIIIIVVVGILAALVVFGYHDWRNSNADSVVQSELSQATSSLEAKQNFTNTFPPNFAAVNYTPAPDTAMLLYTNADSIGVYENLDEDENAQLLLNVCNAAIFELATSNTACTFAGNNNGAKIHVKGTGGSNEIWNSPIAQSDVVLTCGPECDAAVTQIIEQFTAQGGSFPVTVSGTQTSLPEPTQTPNGTADEYCLEARSGTFPDVVYHSSFDNPAVNAGACPDDPDLHYYP